MNREIIDKVFRRDFEKLLCFDIFEVHADLDYLLDKRWVGSLVIEAVHTPLTIFKDVLDQLMGYLRYDPERFAVPMDQYIHIYENREAIMAVIGGRLKVTNAFQDPVLYSLHRRLEVRFERFFENIMQVGKAHNFEEENLADILELEDLYGFNKE